MRLRSRLCLVTIISSSKLVRPSLTIFFLRGAVAVQWVCCGCALCVWGLWQMSAVWVKFSSYRIFCDWLVCIRAMVINLVWICGGGLCSGGGGRRFLLLL